MEGARRRRRGHPLVASVLVQPKGGSAGEGEHLEYFWRDGMVNVDVGLDMDGFVYFLSHIAWML